MTTELEKLAIQGEGHLVQTWQFNLGDNSTFTLSHVKSANLYDLKLRAEYSTATGSIDFLVFILPDNYQLTDGKCTFTTIVRLYDSRGVVVAPCQCVIGGGIIRLNFPYTISEITRLEMDYCAIQSAGWLHPQQVEHSYAEGIEK